MAPPIKVGIIGYGLSAKVFHIPLIQSLPDLFTLSGIVQRTPTPSSDCRQNHPSVTHHNDISTLTSDPSISLIIITTPPSTHFSLAHAALQAGKNVVVEKPFLPTLEDASTLTLLAKSKNLLLTVYHNRRWDADYLLVRSLLTTNRLGRVVEFETHFDRHRPHPPAVTWKSTPAPGNGAIYDLGAHLFDQVLQLFGAPKGVTGIVRSQRKGGGGAADACTVILHYPDGLLVTVKAGVVSCEKEQLRFWVRGEEGSVWIGGTDAQEEQLKGRMKPGEETFAKSTQGAWVSREEGAEVVKEKVVVDGEGKDYRDFYRGVSGALRGEGDPPVKVEEAMDVIKLICLAIRSSEEGRTLEF
ncbi:MAG: hypothetical protein M1814_006222 [Vezdaea aestivalis]|nr:MAG: hypothetical protein M1814_006222 [Vezdaea aestivalis]